MDLLNPDMGLTAPTVKQKSAPDLRELTAQLIASRRRLSDLDHLIEWNNDLAWRRPPTRILYIRPKP